MDTAYKSVHFSIRNWHIVTIIYIGIVLMLIVEGEYRGMDTTYKSVHFSIRNWHMVTIIYIEIVFMFIVEGGYSTMYRLAGVKYGIGRRSAKVPAVLEDSPTSSSI